MKLSLELESRRFLSIFTLTNQFWYFPLQVGEGKKKKNPAYNVYLHFLYSSRAPGAAAREEVGGSECTSSEEIIFQSLHFL